MTQPSRSCSRAGRAAAAEQQQPGSGRGTAGTHGRAARGLLSPRSRSDLLPTAAPWAGTDSAGRTSGWSRLAAATSPNPEAAARTWQRVPGRAQTRGWARKARGGRNPRAALRSPPARGPVSPQPGGVRGPRRGGCSLPRRRVTSCRRKRPPPPPLPHGCRGGKGRARQGGRGRPP